MKCITADARGHSPSPERLVQPTWRSGSLSVSLLIQRTLLNFASRHLRLGGILCVGHGLSELRSGLCLSGTTVGKTVNCHYPLHWQDLELFFTYGHRRSCSILQRNSTEDASITQRMSELLKSASELEFDGFNKTTEDVKNDALELLSDIQWIFVFNWTNWKVWVHIKHYILKNSLNEFPRHPSNNKIYPTWQS